MYFISLPNFQISVHEALRPLLRSLPFAISDNGKIIAMNQIAEGMGVREGMLTTLARKKAYSLVTQKPKPHNYSQFAKQFYTLLSSFSSSIEPLTPTEVYVSFENAPAFDPEEKGYELYKKISAELELPVRIGFGSNKTVAELANKVSETPGCLIVAKEAEKGFLQKLPVSMLPGLGKRTGALLSGMGIATIGAFSSLSENAIEKLFGTHGKMLKELALGHDPRPLKIPEHQKSLTRSLALSKESSRQEYLHALFGYLVHSIVSDMNKKSLSAQAITVQCELTNGKTKSKKKKLSPTEYNLKIPAQIAFHELLAKMDYPVTKISISCCDVAPMTNTSFFFDYLTQKIRESFAFTGNLRSNRSVTPFSYANTLLS